jgi:hypothetical protein
VEVIDMKTTKDHRQGTVARKPESKAHFSKNGERQGFFGGALERGSFFQGPQTGMLQKKCAKCEQEEKAENKQEGKTTVLADLQRSSAAFDAATISITKDNPGPVTLPASARFTVNIPNPAAGTFYYYRWSVRDAGNLAYVMRSVDDDTIVQGFGRSKHAYLNKPSLQKMYERRAGKQCKVLCRIQESNNPAGPDNYGNDYTNTRLVSLDFEFAPSHQDYEQSTEETKHALWDESQQQGYSEVLKGQNSDLSVDVQHTMQMIVMQRASLFNKLENSKSDIPPELKEKWQNAVLSIENIETMLRNQRTDDITADIYKTTITSFYYVLIKVQRQDEKKQREIAAESKEMHDAFHKEKNPCESQKCHTPNRDSGDFQVVKAPPPYSPILEGYFYQAMSARAMDDWLKMIENFGFASSKMDDMLISRLGGSSEDAQTLNYSKGLLAKQQSFQKEHPFAVRIPAVFYPKDTIIDLPDKSGIKKKAADGIPWLFYLYNTGYRGTDRLAQSGGKWVLTDMTSPEHIQVDEEPSSDLDAAKLQQGSVVDPPKALFEKLNKAVHFPKGRLYWTMPSGTNWTLETTEPMTLSAFLGYLALGAAALSLLLGPEMLIFSSVLGVGSTVMDMHEKSEAGTLSRGDIFKGALLIAADIATAMTAGLGRIASIAGEGIDLARVARLAGRYYVPVKRAAAVLDAANIIVLADSFVDQFSAVMNQSGMTAEQRQEAIGRLVLTGIFLGVVATPTLKNAVEEVAGGAALHLETNEAGELFVKADRPHGTALPKDDKEFMELMKSRPKPSNEELLREFEIAQKSSRHEYKPDGEFVEEMPAGNGHTWKRGANGVWCRFSNGRTCVLFGEGLEEMLQVKSPGSAGVKGYYHPIEEQAPRGELMKNMGVAKRKGWQAHHIIPYQLAKTDPLLMKIIEDYHWDINEALNGIMLPENEFYRGSEKISIHFGSHPVYTGMIDGRLDQIWQRYQLSLISENMLVSEVETVIADFRAKLTTGKFRLSKTKPFAP